MADTPIIMFAGQDKGVKNMSVDRHYDIVAAIETGDASLAGRRAGSTWTPLPRISWLNTRLPRPNWKPSAESHHAPRAKNHLVVSSNADIGSFVIWLVRGEGV